MGSPEGDVNKETNNQVQNSPLSFYRASEGIRSTLTIEEIVELGDINRGLRGLNRIGDWAKTWGPRSGILSGLREDRVLLQNLRAQVGTVNDLISLISDLMRHYRPLSESESAIPLVPKEKLRTDIDHGLFLLSQTTGDLTKPVWADVPPTVDFLTFCSNAAKKTEGIAHSLKNNLLYLNISTQRAGLRTLRPDYSLEQAQSFWEGEVGPLRGFRGILDSLIAGENRMKGEMFGERVTAKDISAILESILRRYLIPRGINYYPHPPIPEVEKLEIMWSGSEAAGLFADFATNGIKASEGQSDFRIETYVGIGNQYLFGKEVRKLEIIVLDTGKGFKPEMIKGGTVEFVRGQSGFRDQGLEGTGIGLTDRIESLNSYQARLEGKNRITGGASLRVIFPLAS